MSEDSEPHFTITFGQSGRVVKRSERALEDGISGSGSVSGSKLSVKDRLGTIVDDSLEDRSHHMFKRQRVDENKGVHKRNGSNDTSLGNGDLRFKLMQKNVETQFLDNDVPTNMDLRDKLSSKSTLLPAHGRRSRSPIATLGKRKTMLETRDNYDSRLHNMVEDRTYDGGRQSMREPRGTNSHVRQSIRDPRDTFGVERQRMRDLRGTYSVGRPSMRDPRDNYDINRRWWREPRDNYNVERRSMREPRDIYNVQNRSMRGPRDIYNVQNRSMRGSRDNYDVERRSMREPRDSYDVERRSMREPRDSYDVERRSMREPRDSYDAERPSMRGPRGSYNVERRTMRETGDAYHVGRRSMQEPRDGYSAGRRSVREPRDTDSIERRSMREPRDGYSVEEQSVQERGDTYSVGRRSNREPRDTCNVERHSIQEPKESYSERRSMREPRDACIAGKPNMLDSRDGYDYRRMGNMGPGSSMESDVPAVGHARTPYTLDNLSQESPDRVYESSMSPESDVEELQRKALIRTYDDGGTANAYRRNEVSSPQTQSAARSATHIKQPGLNVVLHLPGNATPVTAQFPQSSRAVPRIPDHGEELTIDGFLQSLDLEEYSSHFNDEEVDFHALREMNDIELKELGIPMGPRKRILHALSLHR